MERFLAALLAHSEGQLDEDVPLGLDGEDEARFMSAFPSLSGTTRTRSDSLASSMFAMQE